MIQTLIEIIGHTIVPLGGVGVFLSEVVQELVMVIPSTLISLSFGFFFLHGSFSVAFVKTLLFTIAIPAALGLTVGSLVVYSIAWWGGQPIIERFGKYVGISMRDIEKLNRTLEKTEYDEILIVLARIFPPIPSVVVAAWAGVMRMKAPKYALLTFVGAFFKALLWAIIGWQLGHFYIYYAVKIERFEHVALAVLAILFVAYLVYRKNRRKVVA